MAKIAILGAGTMGSAFTIPLSDNGHAVHLVGTHLDEEIIEQLHANHPHPSLNLHLPNTVQFHSYDRLDEVLQGVDLLVVAVSSLGIDWVAMILGIMLPPDVPLLLLSEGLEGDKEGIHTLSHSVRDGLLREPHDSVQIAAMSGPYIAVELACRHHTTAVVAGTNLSLLNLLARLISTPYCHIWTSTDMIGIEVCSALKNLYALAVGIGAGLADRESSQGESPSNQAVMHNSAAAIFAQSIWEITHLVNYMGGQHQSVLGGAGAGALYAACQGQNNSRMGCLLGAGMKYTDAKRQHMPHDTIEGAELALAIGGTIERMIYEDKLSVKALPLLRTMIHIVCNDETAQIAWSDFFATE